jgi:hypothetical protein
MGSLLTGTWERPGAGECHDRVCRSSPSCPQQDYRLDSAWFGQGAQLKGKALEHALALVE